ncbi:unnamed protein product [Rotaria sp. Silwood1]|nr:unnamed protein product [Rotaria sp. Silwood1]CAF1296798.1 unnamed protein product [Rotaria sp. Silwood1]CAF3533826.1 unnamed protein product [Rotaria sp. Silwood1]CAF4619180.1 unnamed protein product [Rotaria sp. Silwood1]CAF4817419.1 unnamed protein product [Rotaria sp. Silwood1]
MSREEVTRSSSITESLPSDDGALSSSIVLQHSQRFKRLKPLNFSLLRWNLLWLFVIVVFITLPIWLRFASQSCQATYYTIISILLWLDLVWFLALVFSIYTLIKLKYGMLTDHKQNYPADAPLIHLLILTIYNDDMGVICRTVDSLAEQTEAKRIVLVIAWESRTPDREERTETMRNRYSDKFYSIIFPVHPYGLENEVASKAANANWGLREAVRYIMADEERKKKTEHVMVTTCDADTLFHSKYFEALSADYLRCIKENDPAVHRTIWQAPLFYNWNLDQNSFPVRITGLVRSLMTMGLLIPYNVNPMSCFSFSLTLAVRGGYWHPQIFMDDVGYLLTMMIGRQKRIRIRLLPVPVRSGPTSGDNWLNDVKEWYTQVRRWGIGTADNFHYFAVKVPRLPILASCIFAIGYFLYYGVILCSASLFSVSSGFFPLLCPNFELPWLPKQFHAYYLHLLIAIIIPQLLYGILFILDAIWCKWTLNVKEDIFILRNILHWILTPLTLIALSLVQLWSYIVLAVQGKKACIHKLAGKATLAQVDSGA